MFEVFNQRRFDAVFYRLLSIWYCLDPWKRYKQCENWILCAGCNSGKEGNPHDSFFKFLLRCRWYWGRITRERMNNNSHLYLHETLRMATHRTITTLLAVIVNSLPAYECSFLRLVEDSIWISYRICFQMTDNWSNLVPISAAKSWNRISFARAPSVWDNARGALENKILSHDLATLVPSHDSVP